MNLKKLYKLPWTEKNNPNWWIEPTTHCQLKCPWCYRWLDKWKIKLKHLDIEILKKQVLNFKKHRNIQTVSISWWEPLMYPNIFELIEFIYSEWLFSKLYTNWIWLDKELLTKLKNSWLTEIVIHIDMFQNRPEWIWKNESELNILRKKYVNLFKEVPSINLGFIMPIWKENLKFLPELLTFYRKNIETINLIVFTVFKDVNNDNNSYLNAEKLSDEIKKITKYNPSSYLPKLKNPQKPAWLMSMWFWNNITYFWDIDSNIYKIIMEKYYKKWKKYFITRKRKKISIFWIFWLIFSKKWREIIKNIIKSKNFNIFYQVILIIEPPSYSWDRCNWCPDLMYIWDKLYPSCMINKNNDFKNEYF